MAMDLLHVRYSHMDMIAHIVLDKPVSGTGKKCCLYIKFFKQTDHARLKSGGLTWQTDSEINHCDTSPPTIFCGNVELTCTICYSHITKAAALISSCVCHSIEGASKLPHQWFENIYTKSAAFDALTGTGLLVPILFVLQCPLTVTIYVSRWQ